MMVKPIDPTRAVVLDTETTGLDDSAEIVQIAVIDAMTDEVLVDTLIRPVHRIPAVASNIHGIHDADVQDAPSWYQIAIPLYHLLKDRSVIIYNADYDLRLMRQSSALYALDWPDERLSVACAMEWYAEYYGVWSDHHGGYRRQRLNAACQQQGIETEGFHRALGDCRATLALVLHVNETLRRLTHDRGK